MNLNKNTIAVLIAAGAISSAASANPSQISGELVKLDQKAAGRIQLILDNGQASESEKVAQINAVMKRVNFAKEIQSMRLKALEESVQRVGQGMTCGDYNL